MDSVTDYGRLADEMLVEMAKQGNNDACECLLDKYKSLVRSVTRTYFLAGADREDIVQEGMIGLYKAICGYDTEKKVSFVSFAEVCIKRQVISAIKMATRQKHVPLNNYVSFYRENDEDGADASSGLDYRYDLQTMVDPEEIVITRESYDLLTSRLSEILSSFEQEVLRLFLKGKSYQEMADELHKDIKSIDNALQRMKKKLRPELYS